MFLIPQSEIRLNFSQNTIILRLSVNSVPIVDRCRYASITMHVHKPEPTTHLTPDTHTHTHYITQCRCNENIDNGDNKGSSSIFAQNGKES